MFELYDRVTSNMKGRSANVPGTVVGVFDLHKDDIAYMVKFDDGEILFLLAKHVKPIKE